MRKLFYLCVLAAGCTKPNPALSCEDGLCSDPTVPYCDVSGSLGGDAPNTCIHVSCTPNDFAECRGDKAVTCNATGDDYDLLTCSQGCDASMGGCKPEPPCETLDCMKHIIPKYLPTECDSVASTASLTISANSTLDTSMAGMCTRIVQQTGGPELCVLHYGTITIEESGTLTVTGTRALALVGDQAVLVDGILDVSSPGYPNGPGGGFTASVPGTSNNTTAGGGAGGNLAGGSGATNTSNGGLGNGGLAATNPATLTYLVGGARSDTNAGNGGGAVTLIACRGAVSVQGLIDAAGGGGAGGKLQTNQMYRNATGGGAGGTVVLQGMTLSLTGSMFANGGGGGAGGPSDATGGAKGTRSTTPAAGGTTPAGGPGGLGGTEAAPGPGIAGNGTGNGAGGGAAGFLLTYTPSGVAPMANGFVTSPMISTNLVIETN